MDNKDEVVTSKKYEMSAVPEHLRPVVICLIEATEVFQEGYDTLENIVSVAQDIDDIYGKRQPTD